MPQSLAYCNEANVKAYAVSQGQTAWMQLPADIQLATTFYATAEITAYHKQGTPNGQLWAFQELREAAIYRCMFLSRMNHLRDTKEAQEYLKLSSDGIITYQDGETSGLDQITKSMVDAVINKKLISEGEYARG
jgi:hypothetical protein